MSLVVNELDKIADRIKEIRDNQMEIPCYEDYPDKDVSIYFDLILDNIVKCQNKFKEYLL